MPKRTVILYACEICGFESETFYIAATTQNQYGITTEYFCDAHGADLMTCLEECRAKVTNPEPPAEGAPVEAST